MKLNIFPSLVVGLLLISVTNSAIADDEACLTDKQKEQLETSVTAIRNFLKVTSKTLERFAESENDKDVRERLLKAEDIVDAVNDHICANLTEIIEEACGTCSNIVQAVSDGIEALEETLLEIEPEWKDNTVYKEIKIAVKAIISMADELCPELSLKLQMAASDCLTEKQDRDLKTAVKVLKTVLGAAVGSLDVAISAEDDDNIKSELVEARKVIVSVSNNIVDRLVAIAEEACGTCSEIVKTIDDSVKALEDTIASIDPEWRSSPIYKDIIVATTSMLEIAANSCPPSIAESKVTMESCLSDTQEEQLKLIVKYLDKVFRAAVVSLDVAASAVQDEEIQKNLKEAAKIIHAIEKDIVEDKLVNLTEEASCGSCKDIVGTITDGIHAVEDTISIAVPEWSENPIFKSVVQAVDEVLSIAGGFCDPDAILKLQRSCLSPEEEEKAKVIIKHLDEAFKLAVLSLDVVARAVDSDDLKEKLELAAKIIDAIEYDIVKSKLLNLTKEASCGSCEDVIDTVRDGISALEDVLDEVVPDWTDNPIFAAVDGAIKFMLPLVERACERKQEPVIYRLRGGAQQLSVY